MYAREIDRYRPPQQPVDVVAPLSSYTIHSMEPIEESDEVDDTEESDWTLNAQQNLERRHSRRRRGSLQPGTGRIVDMYA